MDWMWKGDRRGSRGCGKIQDKVQTAIAGKSLDVVFAEVEAGMGLAG
jgi:hypothetical protein